MKNITITAESPATIEADCLLQELSRKLQELTGSSGKKSFDISDLDSVRAVFVLARDEEGHAIGCGAIRPMTNDIAELKRIYATIPYAGIGTAIVTFLEQEAIRLNYSAIRLETRLINTRAVIFYENLGYHRIENYGKYKGRTEAICFEKIL